MTLELLELRDRGAARHAVGTTPRLNALTMVFVPAAPDSDDPEEGRVVLLLLQADGTGLIVRNVGIHHRFDAGFFNEYESNSCSRHVVKHVLDVLYVRIHACGLVVEGGAVAAYI